MRFGLRLPELFFQIGKLILRFSPLERNTVNVLTHKSECILFQDRSFSNTATLRLTGQQNDKVRWRPDCYTEIPLTTKLRDHALFSVYTRRFARYEWRLGRSRMFLSRFRTLPQFLSSSLKSFLRKYIDTYIQIVCLSSSPSSSSLRRDRFVFVT